MTVALYQQSIRSSFRSLWSGSIDIVDFITTMNSAIERGFERAWRQGSKECGIRPEERTRQEQQALNQLIITSKTHVFSVGQWILNNSKGTGKLASILDRSDIWINRYNETKEKAKQLACSDQKFVWHVGPTEHCITCLRLNNRVMRMSRWQELDIHPRDTRPGKLACKGYRCQCRRTRTNQRATPGPLPRI